jgi:hypothetical protein
MLCCCNCGSHLRYLSDTYELSEFIHFSHRWLCETTNRVDIIVANAMDACVQTKVNRFLLVGLCSLWFRPDLHCFLSCGPTRVHPVLHNGRPSRERNESRAQVIASLNPTTISFIVWREQHCQRHMLEGVCGALAIISASTEGYPLQGHLLRPNDSLAVRYR